MPLTQAAILESEQPNAPVWLKVLVVLHIVAITVWALPQPKAVMDGNREPIGTEWILVLNQQHLKTFQPIQAYLFTTGFWQYWDMFSPNPSQTDIWADADVIYADGTKKRYAYPRMADLPIFQKFLQERYRKFYERVNQDDHRYLWPVFAQRIALLNDNPSNPPVKVVLRRHWYTIPAPGMPAPKEYSSYEYYEHEVDSNKLERDRQGYF